MGLKASKHGPIDPKLLAPQGLYPLCDVDLKRLKRYILAGRLAPCHPGQDAESDRVRKLPASRITLLTWVRPPTPASPVAIWACRAAGRMPDLPHALSRPKPHRVLRQGHLHGVLPAGMLHSPSKTTWRAHLLLPVLSP